MGEPLTGENRVTSDFATSLAISGDGLLLALSVPFAFDGTEVGRIYIFRFNGSEWRQFGNAIKGKEMHERAGLGLACLMAPRW